MKLRRATLAAFAAAALAGCSGTATLKSDRGARRALPTTTSTVAIVEGDEGWDCKTMGNHICGDGSGNLTIWFTIDGSLQGFDINDPHRPGCFIEPGNTETGYEIIFYSRISGRGAPEFIGDRLGFEVRCP
jgi:hypothetical protein